MEDKEIQKHLDEQKWFTSQMYKEDLSGKMIYCFRCNKQTCTSKCSATQKEREEQSLCAKAFSKIGRK